MLTFTLAVFFLIITPGPGVLSAAGVGAAHGFRIGLDYVSGLFVGNFVVGIAVISGIAAILEIYPALRIVLAIASSAYLLFLAAKIAFAGSKIAFIHSEKPPRFGNGLALQAINPKAYVVNTALFSGFPFMPDSLFAETLVKILILNAIWIPIHLVWLGAGVGLHRLNLSKPVQFAINVFMALSMLTVVALAALSQQ